MELRDLVIQHSKTLYDLEKGNIESDEALARINDLTNEITAEVHDLVQMTEMINLKYWLVEEDEVEWCYKGGFDTENDIEVSFVLWER